MHFLLKSLGILLVAFLFGVADAWLNSNAPAWSESELAEGEILIVDALKNENTLWVDARTEAEYERGSISGSILLNEDRWDELFPDFLSIWQPEQLVVVYCSSLTCQASHALAERLRSEVGLDNVFVLKGGWEAWQEYQR